MAGLIYFHIRDVYLGNKQIHFPLQFFLQEPLIWLDLIDRFQVSIAFGPNFAYSLVNDCVEANPQRQWDLSSMKFFLNGAEAIVAKTARRFLQLLAPHGLADDLFVEVGSPIPGVDLRIVDDRNQVVAEGEIGAL